MHRLPPPPTWRVTAYTLLTSPKSHLVVGVAVAMISLLTFLHIAGIPSAAAYGFVGLGSALAVASMVRWVLSNIEHKKNQEALQEALHLWEAEGGSAEVSQKILSAFQSHATELDLSRAKLSSLPDAIASLPKLRTVHLYGNDELKELPESVRNQPSLAVLVDSTQRKQFSNQDQHILNQSMKIYLDAWGTTAGEFGYIAQNRILDAYLQQTDTLHLSNLKLPHLPKSMEALQSVKTLNLDNNALSSLEEIQHLPLQELNANGNPLTVFPKLVFSFQNMVVLALCGMGFPAIPDEFDRLSHLIRLELAGNQLTSIPQSIFRCAALEMLNLGNNQLKVLPAEIGLLRNLQSLLLNNNTICEVPSEARQLQQLQILDLAWNQCENMPDEITELTELQRISLAGNRLNNLPNTIGNLRKMTHLDLAHNSYTSIPHGIEKLEALIVLDFSNNRLGGSHFPDQIKQLKKLEQLFLAHTRLMGTLQEIPELPALTILDLSENQINHLPKNMDKLPSLECLDLHGNKNLTDLPIGLLKLPKLGSVTLFL